MTTIRPIRQHMMKWPMKDKLIRQLVNVLALPVFSMNANLEDLEQTKKALEKAKQMGFEPLYP